MRKKIRAMHRIVYGVQQWIGCVRLNHSFGSAGAELHMIYDKKRKRKNRVAIAQRNNYEADYKSIFKYVIKTTKKNYNNFSLK